MYNDDAGPTVLAAPVVPIKPDPDLGSPPLTPTLIAVLPLSSLVFENNENGAFNRSLVRDGVMAVFFRLLVCLLKLLAVIVVVVGLESS
jgi:hypothetical protein